MTMWTPSTAYLAGAVVTETTGLPLWRCTVAGTSGNSEPTWPTIPPFTIADSNVTWVLNTTFRQDVQAGIMSTLGGFRTANPTLLRKVWSIRPSSFTLGDLPAAVVANLTESIVTTQGIRTRTMNGFTVEVIDRTPDNAEAITRMNLLIDAILDYISPAYHMASPTSIVTPIGVGDGDSGAVGEGTNIYWFSNLITFFADIREGRT